jgi:hypothetical protein
MYSRLLYLIDINVRFQVLTVEIMKMTAIWDTAMSSLVEVERRFGGVY